VVLVTALIVEGLFTYSLTTIYNESLVNTTASWSPTGPSLNSISELPVDNINNLPDAIADMGASGHSDQGVNYVDIGVQTESKSLWLTFKTWLKDVFSVRDSDVGTFGHDGVDNWRNNLDSIQSVVHPDSESLLTTLGFNAPSESTLENLVNPDDSISNVSDIISVSNVVETTGTHLVDRAQILTDLALNNPLGTTDLTVLGVWAGI
jgi:hypothetical protein